MIRLDDSDLLLKSRNYRLYNHPTHQDVLLKVRADIPVRHHLIPRYAERRYGNLRQWNREANEYLAALHRGCPEITRLARFMGFTRTTEGPALQVEKLTGPDGGLAPTVSDEVSALEPSDPRRREIHDEVMDLVDDLERGQIIVGDLYLDNIVRAVERNGRLVIIDGLGERVLLPLTLFSRTAFKRSIARRRRRLSIYYEG